MTYQEIKQKIDTGLGADEAIRLLSEYIEKNPQDDTALTERGRLYWSTDRRSDALNDYLAAVKINPTGPASMRVKTAYEILNFYNKDLYNP